MNALLYPTYKITDHEMMTKNATKWGIGVTHKSKGKGGLCTSGVIHCCDNISLAGFVIPTSGVGELSQIRVWKALRSDVVDRNLYTEGVTTLTTVEELSYNALPIFTKKQRLTTALNIEKRINFINDSQWSDLRDSFLESEENIINTDKRFLIKPISDRLNENRLGVVLLDAFMTYVFNNFDDLLITELVLIFLNNLYNQKRITRDTLIEELDLLK